MSLLNTVKVPLPPNCFSMMARAYSVITIAAPTAGTLSLHRLLCSVRTTLIVPCRTIASSDPAAVAACVPSETCAPRFAAPPASLAADVLRSAAGERHQAPWGYQGHPVYCCGRVAHQRAARRKVPRQVPRAGGATVGTDFQKTLSSGIAPNDPPAPPALIWCFGDVNFLNAVPCRPVRSLLHPERDELASSVKFPAAGYSVC